MSTKQMVLSTGKATELLPDLESPWIGLMTASPFSVGDPLDVEVVGYARAGVTWEVNARFLRPNDDLLFASVPGGSTIAGLAGFDAQTNGSMDWYIPIDEFTTSVLGSLIIPSSHVLVGFGSVYGQLTPSAPTSVVAATNGHLAAHLEWDLPASDGGSPIIDTVVTIHPGGSTMTLAGNVDQADITGLDNDVSYTFTVHMTNANGNGEQSLPSNAITAFQIWNDDFSSYGYAPITAPYRQAATTHATLATDGTGGVQNYSPSIIGGLMRQASRRRQHFKMDQAQVDPDTNVSAYFGQNSDGSYHSFRVEWPSDTQRAAGTPIKVLRKNNTVIASVAMPGAIGGVTRSFWALYEDGVLDVYYEGALVLGGVTVGEFPAGYNWVSVGLYQPQLLQAWSMNVGLT